ncbi:MAG: peptidyl-prolyl cis-trans isomerase [Candidatus Cloacimonadaceae bacterium]|nr:peptidyl-prolyl cis-trans isomerase [Candidatus Cloacimonadota bacterium]MCB5255654.1 peptidyl-prolyl cis-trans isomerase [Candidatus Cloacimonadota bacterium]MCK9178447.1 peptidyl-prolyl cis-trans isomerase [Candidatus Cloacimonadota bacterium]MCK9242610.1 peptidyl-prolyl cis-trans isomerase [Candidatus Cloacimonadota bacterium]MDY0127061.1 peptidyl-prolyl cis-trans isomerase [Candidatus Cloacimonadaceae bacterium]
MSRPTHKPLLISIMLFIAALAFAKDADPIAVSNSNLLEESDILAEFDGGRILRSDLQNKISKIPPAHQARFQTVEGQLQVLDIMCTEEVFFQKAKDLGLDKSPETLERLDDLEKRFYLQEYYKRNVTEVVTIHEEDLQDYYDKNLKLFYMNPNITIEYIQTATEQDALDAIAELKAGASFAEVSDTYNQNTYALGLKGKIKNIRLNGNIPGVGNDHELEEHISQSSVDPQKINGPYQTEMGWHIFRTTDWVPGRQKEYLEVKPEIEQRIRPIKEREKLEIIREQLKQKYDVQIHAGIASAIDLQNRANNEEIMYNVVVHSSNDDLIYTIQDILMAYDKISPQEQIFYIKGEGAKAFIDQRLIQDLFHLEAKNMGYERYFEDNEDYQTMRHNFILRGAFEKLVLESIEISDEEIDARYELDKDKYSTPANRSIQVLFFDDMKTANKAWRKFRSAHKKNKEKTMDKLIQKYSTKPDKSIYENQYDNGVVTGLVQDADFSSRIWDNPVGYLSDVFTAANGDIVFFRTLSETPKSYRPKVEVEPRIYNAIKQEKEKSQQDTVAEQLFVEYNLIKYPERIKLNLSAEQLFDYADNAARNRNYKDAITFYEQIVQNYDNGVDDYKAYFMKAFLVAEELKNEDLAIDLFRNFIQIFPEGDLHESARFMIDSLEGNIEGFEDFE